MTEIVTPQVQLIAWTRFEAPLHIQGPWTRSGEEVAHFAGRACYQSWHRPNPDTATTEGYLNHIKDQGHFSVLEHATATFYLTGVSRALTHELIRHRHLSYSQLSQRFASPDGTGMVVPPLLAKSEAAKDVLREVSGYLAVKYEQLLELSKEILDAEGTTGTSARKRAREAARAVLPNAAETRIVVTGNLRAWRHFIAMRATAAADREICDVAMTVLAELRQAYPHTFNDWIITQEPDGRETARSAYGERS